MGGDLVIFWVMGRVPHDKGSAEMSERNTNPKFRYIHYIYIFFTFDNTLCAVFKL